MARDSLASILGPLSVNMYLANFALAMDDTDIVNCADDNTPYITEDDLDGVIASLTNASNTLFKWFSENLFKGNANKCHLLVNVNF